jgi:hypothetical protein
MLCFDSKGIYLNLKPPNWVCGIFVESHYNVLNFQKYCLNLKQLGHVCSSIRRVLDGIFWFYGYEIKFVYWNLRLCFGNPTTKCMRFRDLFGNYVSKMHEMQITFWKYSEKNIQILKVFWKSNELIIQI